MNPRTDNQDNGLFDLIDVIGFVWRGRYFIAACTALTLIASLVASYLRTESRYITFIPLNIEGHKNVEPLDLVSKWNGFLHMDEAKELIESFSAKPGPKKDISLSFKEIGNRLILHVMAKDSDPSGQRAYEMAESIAMLIQNLNTEKKASIGNIGALNSLPINGEEELRKIYTIQSQEESPYLLELMSLEAELKQRVKVDEKILKSNQPLDLGGEVLRLLALADNQLTTQEKDLALEKYSNLVGHIQSIRAKYSKVQFTLADNIGRSIELRISDKSLLPEFRPDQQAYQDMVARHKHESTENKLFLYVWLGIFLGFLFGIMSYGTVTYFRMNTDRLKKLLK
jgi:hypothetical protein